MKGYAGKFLRVNLSDVSIKKEDFPKDFPKKFLGGLGFASWILYQELKHVEPLSPKNKLIVAPGLLAATGIPTASKTVFVSRSPKTKCFGRKDDTLPYRVLVEPIPKGKSKGSYVKPKELEKMLDEYYQARGWSEDGIPTKAKLVALGLPEVAEEVGASH